MFVGENYSAKFKVDELFQKNRALIKTIIKNYNEEIVINGEALICNPNLIQKFDHNYNVNMKVGEKNIGKGCKPFIIAEMSGNHNPLDHALKL